MKRKIFRRITALLCAVMMVFVAGCGNSAKESNNVKQEEVTTQAAGNENFRYLGCDFYASSKGFNLIDECLLLHFNFKNTSDRARSASDTYYIHIYQDNLEVSKCFYDYVPVETNVSYNQSIMPGGEAVVFMPVELKKYAGKITVHIIPCYSSEGGKEEKIEIDVDEVMSKYKENAAKFLIIDDYKIECINKNGGENYVVSFDVTNNSSQKIDLSAVYELSIVQNGTALYDNYAYISGLCKESRYAAEAYHWRGYELEAGQKVRLCMEYYRINISPDEPITVKATPKESGLGLYVNEVNSGDITVIK